MAIAGPAASYCSLKHGAAPTSTGMIDAKPPRPPRHQVMRGQSSCAPQGRYAGANWQSSQPVPANRGVHDDRLVQISHLRQGWAEPGEGWARSESDHVLRQFANRQPRIPLHRYMPDCRARKAIPALPRTMADGRGVQWACTSREGSLKIAGYGRSTPQYQANRPRRTCHTPQQGRKQPRPCCSLIHSMRTSPRPSLAEQTSAGVAHDGEAEVAEVQRIRHVSGAGRVLHVDLLLVLNFPRHFLCSSRCLVVR